MKKIILYIEILTAVIAVLARINANYVPSGIGQVLLIAFALMWYFIVMSKPKPVDNSQAISYLCKKIGGLAMSISAVGIMFRLQHYPGAGVMLMVGCMTCIITLLLTLLSSSKNPTETRRDEYSKNDEYTKDKEEGADEAGKSFLQKLRSLQYSNTEMAVRYGITAAVAAFYWYNPVVVLEVY